MVEQINECPVPDLLPAKGGWLARSPVGSRFRIAVFGESKEEAIRRFGPEWAAWVALAAKPDPIVPPAGGVS